MGCMRLCDSMGVGVCESVHVLVKVHECDCM